MHHSRDASDWLHSQIGFYQSQFSMDIEISVAVCSFNVNNQRIPLAEDGLEQKIKKWLFMHKCPKIIAVGLQEIDMNAHSVLFGETDARNYWKTMLCGLVGADEDEESINQSYLMVASKQLVGLFLCVFVHKSIRPDLNSREIAINTVSIGKSLGPIMKNRMSALYNFGNKGAVGLHLQFHELSIVFVNAHLHPHIEGLQKRRQGTSTIMKEMTFSVLPTTSNYHLYRRYFHQAGENMESRDNSHNYRLSPHKKHPSGHDEEKYAISIKDHDIVFFFGDLNFRLNNPPNYVLKRAVMTNEWSDVFQKYDQLNNELQIGAKDIHSGWFGFHENHPENSPSYRYIASKNMLDLPHGVLSDDHDSRHGEKGRIPGFTDRILWSEPKVAQSEYRCERNGDGLQQKETMKIRRMRQREVHVHSDIKFSDHKPISALFCLQVPLVLPEKRSEVENRLLKAFEENSTRLDASGLLSVETEDIHYTDLEYGVKQTVSVQIHNTSCNVIPVRIFSGRHDVNAHMVHSYQSPSKHKNHFVSAANLAPGSSEGVRTIQQEFVHIVPSSLLIYPGKSCAVSISCEKKTETLRFQCEKGATLRVGEPVRLQQFVTIEPIVTWANHISVPHMQPTRIEISATLKVSNFGNTLENLLHVSPQPSLGTVSNYSNDHHKDVQNEPTMFRPSLVSYPLWWLVVYLSKDPSVGDFLFMIEFDHANCDLPNDVNRLIALLDDPRYNHEDWETFSEFDSISWASAYAVLIIFLRDVQEPVVEFSFYEAIVTRRNGDFAIIEGLLPKFAPVHRSTFIFVISFLRCLLSRSFQIDREHYTAFRQRLIEDFAAVLLRHPPKVDPFESDTDEREVTEKQLFLEYFLTMEDAEHLSGM